MKYTRCADSADITEHIKKLKYSQERKEATLLKTNKIWHYDKELGGWICPTCSQIVYKQLTEICPNCKTELFWNIIMDGFVQCT